MDTSISGLTLQFSNRRAARRSRLLKSAKLIFGGFSPTVVDCLLTELSDGGVRIETPVMTQLPEVLTLRLSDHTERRVQVRWATGNEVGLAFVSPGH
jgi:hypothetical protein